MLELRHVTKTFNRTGAKEDERLALNDVSLKIETGEFVTIIGGNGSGKSTTLNIVSGLYTPDQGQIFLNDFDITPLKEHQRASFFGRCFQDPFQGTAADMSVIENLEFAYRRGKARSPFAWGFKKANKKAFQEQLKRLDLGLENRLDHKVKVLSGGQRQALTLLMASFRFPPTFKMIRKNYTRFASPDFEKNKNEFDDAFAKAKEARNKALNDLKAKGLSKDEFKNKKAEVDKQFDQAVRKFDIAKQILLLDEHTAALDPKTSNKVLELTDKIVKEGGLTTLMVTHNMKDAIKYGNRLIMFMDGKVVLDVKGEEKAKLTPEFLVQKFGEHGNKVPDTMVM